MLFNSSKNSGLLAFVFVAILWNNTTFSQDVCPPSFDPPGGLALDKVPQLVAFGFDDNNYADGMNWIVDFLKTKTNPAGMGNPGTFDATPVKVTFFIKGMIESSEPEQDVFNSWKKAYENGHEMGNHTYQHIAVDITNELNKCDSVLQLAGVPLKEIIGFRTPQLAIVPSVFDAIYKRKFLYDCTIEHHTETTSGKFIWPYSLENGMHLTTAFGGLTTKYPGMWELPVHEFVDANGGKITTGLDYNAFINSGMGGSAFCNALKGSLTYHMKTNKCPLFIGMHSDLYAKTNVSSGTATDRRSGVESFITYALGQKDVRIVPMKDVITWMRKPVALDQTPIVNKKINSGIAIRLVRMHGNNIEISTPNAGYYTIEFLSVSGKMIFGTSVYCAEMGHNSIMLPGKAIQSGYYIVQLSGNGYSETQKIFIVR